MVEKGRAAIYRGGQCQPMDIVEYPVPDPEPGAILVKVRQVNICGSDLHIWRGDIDFSGGGLVPVEMVIGHETVGEIAKLGAGVTTDSAGQPIAVGDREVHMYFYPCGRCRACLRGQEAACQMAPLSVFRPSTDSPHFNGPYAEYLYLRPNHTIFKIPDDVTDNMAAPVNCALSQVIYGLTKAQFGWGETIAIQGAGGLGLYATAVARDMGADKVIVIDGIDQRLELAKAFGADELIDMKKYKTPEERVQRVKELTGGWGADVVVEVVGYANVFPEGLDMLGSGGRYLEIGNISYGMSFEFRPSSITTTNKSIIAVMLYDRLSLKKAIDFLSRTKDKYPFEKMLSRPYPLEEINKAFEEQDKGLVSRSTIIP